MNCLWILLLLCCCNKSNDNYHNHCHNHTDYGNACARPAMNDCCERRGVESNDCGCTRNVYEERKCDERSEDRSDYRDWKDYAAYNRSETCGCENK